MTGRAYPFPGILMDRRLWLGPFPFILVLFAAFNVWVVRIKHQMEAERRDNMNALDLGLPADGERNYDDTFGEDMAKCLPRIPDARKTPLCIVCGMSQMFTVNDRQPGDKMIVEELDVLLAPKGVRCFGLAAPNLCNEEALLLLLASNASDATKPAVFLYGNCFDKYRNVDLRPGYAEFLRARPELQKAWRQLAEESRERYPAAAEKMLRSLETETATASTAAEDPIEQGLRTTAGRVIPAVAERKDLNAYAQLRLYFLRNKVLGIKNTSKRPVIQSRYAMNKEFLELAMDVCGSKGIKFVTYVIPLNPMAENPYVATEYAEYKQWLESVCTARKTPFANLEGLVLEDEWGTFNGGPDFKHFKGPAHRRTAEAIAERFKSDIVPDAGAAAP